MVDFNNETTISRPPSDIVALIVLEKLYNYLEADEHYNKQRLQNIGASPAIPRARLRSLFLICNPMLKRRITKPEQYNRLYSICIDRDYKATDSDILEAYITLQDMLDLVGLTKLDSKKLYDRTRIEESNREQGF